jgi:hypothetical protein
MANLHRGEIDAVLNGRRWTLCLTLGALAELESHFGVSDLASLAERLSTGTFSARDIMAIIEAGLKGGGHVLDPDEVSEMRNEAGAAGFATIVAELLEATFAPLQTGEPGNGRE